MKIIKKTTKRACERYQSLSKEQKNNIFKNDTVNLPEYEKQKQVKYIKKL